VLIDVASETDGAASAIQLRAATRFDHGAATPCAGVRVGLARRRNGGISAVIRGAIACGCVRGSSPRTLRDGSVGSGRHGRGAARAENGFATRVARDSRVRPRLWMTVVRALVARAACRDAKQDEE
jgi:hypothetical protein